MLFRSILEAIAVLVGLFLAFTAVMWIGLGIAYLFAMLDSARERLWGSVVALFRRFTSKKTNEIPVPRPVAAKAPEEIRLEDRRRRRTFLRGQYADRINPGKSE